MRDEVRAAAKSGWTFRFMEFFPDVVRPGALFRSICPVFVIGGSLVAGLELAATSPVVKLQSESLPHGHAHRSCAPAGQAAIARA